MDPVVVCAVLTECLRFLRNVSLGTFQPNHTNTNHTFDVQAVATGELTYALKAMDQFAENQELQEVACGALHNLVFDCSQSSNNQPPARATKLIVDLKGTEQIVAAMHAFPKNQNIQEFGCKFIV
jgi:hypothetical protein